MYATRTKSINICCRDFCQTLVWVTVLVKGVLRVPRESVSRAGRSLNERRGGKRNEGKGVSPDRFFPSAVGADGRTDGLISYSRDT